MNPLAPDIALPMNVPLQSPVMSASLQTPSMSSVEPLDAFAFQLPQQTQAPPPVQGGMFDWQQAAPTSIRTNTDDNAFDAAIDEIFEENEQNFDDFSNIFDPDMQIPEKIEDDQQLGNILEQLLQNV